jgi:predicted  nucleic acid-binding Zn-ribbon protein
VSQLSPLANGVERAHGSATEHSQANLELVLLHEKQVETRISQQREKIARIRSQGLPTDTDDEELGALQRSLEVLKTVLATMTDPAKGGNIPG